MGKAAGLSFNPQIPDSPVFSSLCFSLIIHWWHNLARTDTQQFIVFISFLNVPLSLSTVQWDASGGEGLSAHRADA